MRASKRAAPSTPGRHSHGQARGPSASTTGPPRGSSLQGDPATRVMYPSEGGAVRSLGLVAREEGSRVRCSRNGRFFGEGCLCEQPRRMATATAMALHDHRGREGRHGAAFHAQPAFADRFLAHMLTRYTRIEEDLIDQLFDSSEKRLARTLLRLARYGGSGASTAPSQGASQQPWRRWWAPPVSRVNFSSCTSFGSSGSSRTTRVEDCQLPLDRRVERLTFARPRSLIAGLVAPSTSTCEHGPRSDEPVPDQFASCSAPAPPSTTWT